MKLQHLKEQRHRYTSHGACQLQNKEKEILESLHYKEMTLL